MKAFSLIELMVVIAVVAVLAAIAVPSYKSYVVSAKVQSVAPALNSVFTSAREYMNTHGDDVSQVKLGLTPYAVGDVVGVNAVTGTYPPSGTEDVIKILTISNFFACAKPGKVAQIIVLYDYYKLGLSSTPGVNGRVDYFVFSANGTNYTRCVNSTSINISGCDDLWGPTTAYVTTNQPGCSD